MKNHITRSIFVLFLLANAVSASFEYEVFNLHPDGADYSYAFGVYGNQQVGKIGGYMSDFDGKATVWYGTPESAQDLHSDYPYNWSIAYDVYAQKQAGTLNDNDPFHVGAGIACTWQNTPESMNNLNPVECDASWAFGIYEDTQVGYGGFNRVNHALLWNDSSESVVDLHSGGYFGTRAYGVSDTQQVGFARLGMGGQDGHYALSPISQIISLLQGLFRLVAITKRETSNLGYAIWNRD